MPIRTEYPRWVRATLLYLALTNALPGIWALFLPHDFYRYFPGFGHAWVAVDGPYNEHLIRDVGAFFLAFTVLCFLAMRRPDIVTLRGAAICLLIFNVPHLWYHLSHLSMLSPIDQLGNVLTLSLGVLLPLILLFHRPVSERSPVSLESKPKTPHE